MLFKGEVSVSTKDSTLCTISDETFALLVIENSFDS
jgi:hypothetical protein